MSTFDGCVTEFPDIRIDFFRTHIHSRPPLACFLSHVHSDHLAGLDTLRSPFVYCSAATREILLRLERYPCRINYAKGILEARQQTYKHLHKVLKPLPLETPVQLELRPGCHIRVTLFDANHCPGAVMFLIEDATNAILYTGDVRSEPWFVNSLARNPNLIEYTSGIRTLDKLYLDTSFIHDVPFQTKAEGLAELISKVKQYPDDTVFHIQAWTYGYEDVWIALSKALNSRIHVDDYKMRIYNSLKARTTDGKFGTELHLSTEAPALVGFICGNTPQSGCLTSEENTRLHSCEKGNVCSVVRHPGVVKIQPIIAHLPGGTDILEAGVGGGADDLEREAELDVAFQNDVEALLEMILSCDSIDENVRNTIRTSLSQAAASGRSLGLNLDMASFKEDLSTPIQEMMEAIAQKSVRAAVRQPTSNPKPANELPRVIRFPYSRHSSYPELCHLISIFKPKDIWPCTVDIGEWLKDGITIESLFGKFCSTEIFSHDQRMEAIAERVSRASEDADTQTRDTQQSVSSVEVPALLESLEPLNDLTSSAIAPGVSSPPNGEADILEETDRAKYLTRDTPEAHVPSNKRDHSEFSKDAEGDDDCGSSQETDRSNISSLSTSHSVTRWRAYYQTLASLDGDDWQPMGLMSTDGGHSIVEKEL